MPFRKGLQIYTILMLNKIYFSKKYKQNLEDNFGGFFARLYVEKYLIISVPDLLTAAQECLYRLNYVHF
jgi:hypothetical protein